MIFASRILHRFPDAMSSKLMGTLTQNNLCKLISVELVNWKVESAKTLIQQDHSHYPTRGVGLKRPDLQGSIILLSFQPQLPMLTVIATQLKVLEQLLLIIEHSR